ncbi:MAG: type II toxin-antitoxin system HicB family antitoxin [Candidatus Blackburnbacteria bacterium]|nr:type II toxin-antitoxin system HicB family antitoxin [Candidatus Blackburnbacteria bacterium]
MKQNIANYTVVIEKEKRLGTNKECYSAVVPVLGIATEADTLDQAQKDIQVLVQFHIESLSEEGEDIPVESKQSFVTKIEALLPKKTHLAVS